MTALEYRIRATLLAGVTTLFISTAPIQPTLAQESQPLAGQLTDSQISQITDRIDETRTRLNLEPAQEAAVRPILKHTLSKSMTILQGYGFSRTKTPSLSFVQKLALRSDMKTLREEANPQIAEILSETQMQIYLEIQKETREKFLKRLTARK